MYKLILIHRNLFVFIIFQEVIIEVLLHMFLLISALRSQHKHCILYL